MKVKYSYRNMSKKKHYCSRTAPQHCNFSGLQSIILFHDNHKLKNKQIQLLISRCMQLTEQATTFLLKVCLVVLHSRHTYNKTSDPNAHITCIVQYQGSFPGVKHPGHGNDQPLPSSTKVTHG